MPCEMDNISKFLAFILNIDVVINMHNVNIYRFITFLVSWSVNNSLISIDQSVAISIVSESELSFRVVSCFTNFHSSFSENLPYLIHGQIGIPFQHQGNNS